MGGVVKADWESFRDVKSTYDKNVFKRKVKKLYPNNHTSYDIMQLMIAHIQDLELEVRGLKHRLEN